MEKHGHLRTCVGTGPYCYNEEALSVWRCKKPQSGLWAAAMGVFTTTRVAYLPNLSSSRKRLHGHEVKPTRGNAEEKSSILQTLTRNPLGHDLGFKNDERVAKQTKNTSRGPAATSSTDASVDSGTLSDRHADYSNTLPDWHLCYWHPLCEGLS